MFPNEAFVSDEDITEQIFVPLQSVPSMSSVIVQRVVLVQKSDDRDWQPHAP